MRGGSLRWHAYARLRDLNEHSLAKRRLQHVKTTVWFTLAKPYLLPVILPAVVIVLATFAPDVGSLPILGGSRFRQVLGTLWQVQGTVLALLTAAALFALEGLARNRPEISVWEYAARSGLTQYLMLGAAGVISVLFILMWPTTTPPTLAAQAAAIISASGLLALPVTLYGSMRVVDPSWLRQQRLADVRRSVNELVDSDALARAAMVALQEWVANLPIDISYRVGFDRSMALETASSRALVADIRLRRLRRLATQEAPIIVLTRVGEDVSKDSILVASNRVHCPAPLNQYAF
jgi:hypothetical protein